MDDLFCVHLQQIQVDKHIEMQLEERDFLRETADTIRQGVYTLEQKVRKKTVDHGWTAALTIEPNWFQDMTGPSIWYTSPPLTAEQLQKMREKYSRNPTQAPITSGSNIYEHEATSGSEVSDNIVILDLVKDEAAAMQDLVKDEAAAMQDLVKDETAAMQDLVKD